MEGCWRFALKIRGGREAPATAVGRSARACARASARFPYDQLGHGRGWGWGWQGNPPFPGFPGLPGPGGSVTHSLPSGKPLAQGRRGTKLTLPSRPAHPRGFFGLCSGFFQFCVPSPLEMNGSRQRGRCRPEFGAGDPSPEARGAALPATKFR